MENNLGDFLETIVHNLKKPKDEVVYNLCKSAWRQLDSLPVDEFLCFYESFIESERVPYFSDEFISSLRNNEVYDINSPCYITNFETNFKDKDLASILGGFVRP